jgi:hypothetical protein
MNYVNTECVTNYVNADDVNKNKQTWDVTEKQYNMYKLF